MTSSLLVVNFHLEIIMGFLFVSFPGHVVGWGCTQLLIKVIRVSAEDSGLGPWPLGINGTH